MITDTENYVCSLEQAIKLKELGVKQDSAFGMYAKAWNHMCDENGNKRYNPIRFVTYDAKDANMYEHSAEYVEIAVAFTLQEILELIDWYSEKQVTWPALKYMSKTFADSITSKAAADLLIDILGKQKERK